MKRTVVAMLVAAAGILSGFAGEITRGGGFRAFPSGGNPKAKSSFVIDADEKRVVVTVDCAEPDVAKLRTSTGLNWRATFSIPLSSFYLTRNSNRKTTWLVNVTRNDRTGGGLGLTRLFRRSCGEWTTVFKAASVFGLPIDPTGKTLFRTVETADGVAIQAKSATSGVNFLSALNRRYF